MSGFDHLLKVHSLLDMVGRTPLIRLRNVIAAPAADVWVKCEQYNPGGSVKDRVARAMIEAAEQAGTIRPERSVIVEPTSGNTGIGLALVCANKGYRLILTMPESMSLERRALLSSYGAEIVLTPAEQAMDGAVARALELCRQHPNYYMPDQFGNPENPLIHKRTTALEILEQTPAPIDAFVAAVGTGGTITGVGSVLRERLPGCRVIAIEPKTSAVISGNPPGPHKIQGIGAGFVPNVLDRGVFHELRTVADRDAWDMKVKLAHREGLLCGISSGANVFVAAEIARELGPGKTVVTVLCDTGERYFSLEEYFA